MEKRKRWQFFVILIAITLTIYNILPTIFYYTKPLEKSIDSEKAEQIALSISNRVNVLEQDAVDWLYSFCDLIGIKCKSIEIDKDNFQNISIFFNQTEDAKKFAKMLPRAGSLIPFVPSQLKLSSLNEDNPNQVIIHRQIPIHFDVDKITDFFTYSEKFDSSNNPTTLYRKLVFDHATQIGLAIAGQSEPSSLITIIESNQDPIVQKELLYSLAQTIVTTSDVFGDSSSISKRYFSSFTQSENPEKSQVITRLISSFEKIRDEIKMDKIKIQNEEVRLKKEGDFVQESQEREKASLERKEVLLTKAETILKNHKTTFSNGNKPWTVSSVLNLLNSTYGEKLQPLNVNANNPYISQILIDWENQKVFLRLHSDLISYQSTLDKKSKKNDQLNQLIINEIARVTRLTDDKITASGTEYEINLSSLNNGKSFLLLDLGKIAHIQATQIENELKQNWTPKHIELSKNEYPIFNYPTYQSLKPSERSLGLVIYAPSEHSEHPPLGMKSSSIYVIAKGLNHILQKYQKDPSSQEAKSFLNDFYALRNLMVENGYIGYPGTSLPQYSEFSNDFIFEKDDYFQTLLKATRENFGVSGTKKYATLEFSDIEQRILTTNKIETQIQEDLLKWRDEYHSAQVSLDGLKKYEVPKPTKNVFLTNLALSARKYYRGDERKILHWGLDLSGGKAVQIQLRDQNNNLVTNEADIKEGINELYQRVNKMGVSEVNIRQEGSTIALDFPGSQSISAGELIKASSMYFHIVNEKFSTNNPSLAENINRFLQEVWNEAVVTNQKDVESINAIAWKHLYGDSPESDAVSPRSESAQVLYDNGLRLDLPYESVKTSAFNDTISKISMIRGDDFSRWQGQAHPLLIVFKNYTLEGANLDNIRTNYDPSKGNFLSFEVKGSYKTKDDQKVYPREDLSNWTSQFSKEKIAGTPNEAFSRGKGWRMAVILNDTVISAPELISSLRDSASITGNFSQREVTKLAADLKAGSLTFTPKILSEKNVSPELGQKEKLQGIIATMIALALVIIAMVGYYRFAGVIASCAVLLNLLIIWATLQNLQATLSLAGIAGIILTVGMAVDANVLVFERIKEEFAKTQKIASAIQTGYKKAFSAIFDSNITTLIAGLILLNFDSGPIRGFAVTLIIGIISSMFTALFLTRYFFAGWVQNPKNKSLKMSNLIKGLNFDFLKKSKFVIAVALVIILVGNFVLINNRQNIFGMDFTGGYTLNLEIDSHAKDLREDVEQAFIAKGALKQDLQIRQLDSPSHLKIFLSASMDSEGKPFYQLPLLTDKTDLQYSFENNPRITWVVDSLKDAGLTMQPRALSQLDTSWTQMSGQMSDTMRNSALLGLFLALISIMVYITFRYEFKYAVSALFCLVHDILISVGTIAILNYLGVAIQIDLHTIAALMTIIGYSLNDTIIIFDRIREDLKVLRKLSFADVINHSINVTLSRTLNTSLTTLLVLVALVILGGPSIFGFTLVMIMGVVFGTLSSIFIASPIMLYFHNKEESQSKALTISESN